MHMLFCTVKNKLTVELKTNVRRGVKKGEGFWSTVTLGKLFLIC